MTTNNKEIFTLFHSLQEKDKILPSMNKKEFISKPHTELFKKFETLYKSEQTSPFMLKYLYCAYIWDCYCSERKIKFSARNDHQIRVLQKYKDLITIDPFDIIASYYTLDYLLKQDKYYLYSDYKDIKSDSQTFYEIEDPANESSETKYYKTQYKSLISEDQSNHTRYIKKVDDNIFHSLVNYSHGRYNSTYVNKYYLNGFLPDVSLQLAERSTSLSWSNFSYNIDTSQICKPDCIISKIKKVFNTYFDILDELWLPNELLHNILTVYKLEYGFGILSLINMIQQREPISSLQALQQYPNIYATMRYSSSSSSKYPSTDEDIHFIISQSKVILSILLLLYPDASQLHEDLGCEIKQQYSRVEEHPFPYEHSINMHTTFSNNGWYMMYKIFECITKKENRNIYLLNIESSIKSMTRDEKTNLMNFLFNRYSPDWFTKIRSYYEFQPSKLF